jgi:hypothetical protein
MGHLRQGKKGPDLEPGVSNLCKRGKHHSGIPGEAFLFSSFNNFFKEILNPPEKI